ncbi:hypothetical protein DHEL01_v206685 [Diaporthe helianthi]|uniref:Uncharacterized protein n=1 Tax=Diaporthe helianthi TaxID=158607 RepID=A0A2P5HXD5_DIAHE|nr:hypothetical protein DHEL01_v206685 [Diaporthe helianthi]
MTNSSISYISTVADSHSRPSQAFNSSSHPTASATLLYGLSSERSSSSQSLNETISDVDVVDSVKTHRVTKHDKETGTAIVTDQEALCMRPGPAAWDPPCRPKRPHPITPVYTSKESGLTSWKPTPAQASRVCTATFV